MANFQDWNKRILNKPTKAVYKNKDKVKERNINDDDDIPKVITINTDLSTKIRKLRVEKGLSQKDLAQKINEKIDVIKNIEAGTAIYNSHILSKIRRILKGLSF